MLKKNQSKSDEKVLPLKIQKKPLPKPDPNLIQIAYKRKEGTGGVKVHKGTGGAKVHKGTGGAKRHK